MSSSSTKSTPPDGAHDPAIDGSGSGSGSRPAKRTRVLLSCGACRYSKLKCDRATPCGQCLKKGRPEDCAYAPRPQKHAKPAKSMAARLKRLEGMVRGMMDVDGNGGGAAAVRAAEAGQLDGVGRDGDGNSGGPAAPCGQVVQGGRSTNYVGGTHFMAILEDIDEMKSFFEDPAEEEEEEPEPNEASGSPEYLMFSKTVPRSKDEILAMLPEKSQIDRLIVRYLNSNAPSQHILHKPTFSRQYAQFWQDPSQASWHWLALLFMVMSLGVFFSHHIAPHELEGDSPIPAMDRFKQYRDIAGWALVSGKYTQPGRFTIPAMLLYIEGDFLASRHAMVNCWLLSSLLIRLMVRTGYHRDPTKLPNISAFDGEMRRRAWNLAIQIDLLVAFHLGMPSMIQGIESDTSLPRHIMDQDFDENSKELPLPRSNTDYTPLTYPINKAALCRNFGLVARQAHSLTVPTYAEVLKLDEQIEETWRQVPSFMRVKPMEESISDPPMQVIQRYGLASLYNKSRCVLHRRYLTESPMRKEHGYSRKVCLEAALQLLEHQNTIWEATKPGALLASNGWFVSSLAINDFLLSDMVIAMVIQHDGYSEVGGNYDWFTQGTPAPTKEELMQRLRGSLQIWQEMAAQSPDFVKAAEVVGLIFKRVESQRSDAPIAAQHDSVQAHADDESESMAGLTIGSISNGPLSDGPTNESPFQGFGVFQNQVQQPLNATNGGLDPIQPGSQGDYDWSQFDTITRGLEDVPNVQGPFPDFLEPNSIENLDFDMNVNASWTPSFS